MSNNPQIQKIRADITKKLHEKNQFTNVLAQVEGKTGVDRFYLFCGGAGLISLYMIFGHFAELLCNAIGFLYPAYVSIKAIESATKDDDTQWLTYWVIFALFNVVEFASDTIVGWFPIYWLLKCVFMVYLWMPSTRGATFLYMKFVRPFVAKHGTTIDKRIASAIGTVGDAVKENMDHLRQD